MGESDSNSEVAWRLRNPKGTEYFGEVAQQQHLALPQVVVGVFFLIAEILSFHCVLMKFQLILVKYSETEL